jgi:hypothetical protein
MTKAQPLGAAFFSAFLMIWIFMMSVFSGMRNSGRGPPRYLRGSGSPSMTNAQPLGAVFFSAFLTIWIFMTVSSG